ncbi:ribonuclease HII [Maricaulis parjimensis]|uniref:ribonuclease HII n=1 Tax=Maricaulis parjimensis TaxID=144023 RepID=UPI003B8310D3
MSEKNEYSLNAAAPFSGPVIAGVDEAGRGPLAGPVVTAAVILDPRNPIAGLGDSKALSARKREALALEIRQKAWVAFGIAEPAEIDRLNILHATMTAMARSVFRLPVIPDKVLIDGNRVPDALPCPAEAIVKGDAKEAVIGAASIMAKTMRDAMMLQAALRFPGYGFEGHKGYPSAAHREALMQLGPCPIHRMSYAPVRLAAESALSTDADACGKLDQGLTPR